MSVDRCPSCGWTGEALSCEQCGGATEPATQSDVVARIGAKVKANTAGVMKAADRLDQMTGGAAEGELALPPRNSKTFILGAILLGIVAIFSGMEMLGIDLFRGDTKPQKINPLGPK